MSGVHGMPGVTSMHRMLRMPGMTGLLVINAMPGTNRFP